MRRYDATIHYGLCIYLVNIDKPKAQVVEKRSWWIIINNILNCEKKPEIVYYRGLNKLDTFCYIANNNSSWDKMKMFSKLGSKL